MKKETEKRIKELSQEALYRVRDRLRKKDLPAIGLLMGQEIVNTYADIFTTYITELLKDKVES